MKNFPKLSEEDVKGKRVLLRADLDVNFKMGDGHLRLNALIPMLKFLSENRAKTTIIGHKGRPDGKKNGKESLRNICEELSKLLGEKIVFSEDVLGDTAKKEAENLKEGDFLMIENLRFDTREEKNDEGFAKELSSYGDLFINEAFATSHREHSSIVGIPKYIPGFLGLRFKEEIDILSKVLENPKRPVVSIISGVKKDKIEYSKALGKICDKVLIGGRLPEYFGVDKSVREYTQADRMIIANLIYDKEDITLHSIEKFKEEIKKAKTIVLAGVLGRYEDEGHRQGTKEIFKAVAGSSAFKIVGGGDSIIAVYAFGLEKEFDWISVGGGAMLQFLISKTLPGIEALLN